MTSIDPLQITENVGIILDNGEWPNFHDAEIHAARFWRGDVRPDDNVWTGPEIELTIELCALEKPFIAVLLFRDCSHIKMTDFSVQNAMLDLAFATEARGYLNDGKPLTPCICVTFTRATGADLSFRCFGIRAVERREIYREQNSSEPDSMSGST